MRTNVIVFCLLLLPFASVYPQAKADTMCTRNIENIFKVHELKIKYETVEYIYKNRECGFLENETFRDNSFLRRSFKLIKDFPYLEEESLASTEKPGESVKVEPMSRKEMSRYLGQLNHTPEEAYKDYKDFIQTIKLEKDVYLMCIEAELAKGTASEYAKERLYYDFMDPRSSIFPSWLTKSDYLIIFKDFILNDDNTALPDFLRVMAYLECGCKIPHFIEFARRYDLKD